MNNLRKKFVIVAACLFLFCPQKGMAGTASNVADKTINYTAKGMYYVTKYTLKASWFLIKKTSKGVYIVSKSVCKATKDAFSQKSSLKYKPVNRKPEDYSEGTLPPPPPILD